MGKHVVVEAVGGEDVGREVGVVVRPVLGELLRAQHQYRLVAQLVVLDNCERSERLSQTNGVGEDAAVVGFQLVDDARRCVALEVVQALPDLRLRVACAVVRQDVLVDVVEELCEQVVEDQEIDACRGVLGVHAGDVVVDGLRDVADLLGVVPDLVEQMQVLLGHRSFVESVHEAGDGVASLVAEIGGGESLELSVGGPVVDHRELLHRIARGVRAEDDLPADPVRALPGDRALGELVAQPDLEIGTGKT